MKLNLDKSEVMLVGTTEIIKDMELPTFDEVLLTIANSGVILAPGLLLENQVNAAATAEAAKKKKKFFPTVI